MARPRSFHECIGDVRATEPSAAAADCRRTAYDAADPASVDVGWLSARRSGFRARPVHDCCLRLPVPAAGTGWEAVSLFALRDLPAAVGVSGWAAMVMFDAHHPGREYRQPSPNPAILRYSDDSASHL